MLISSYIFKGLNHLSRQKTVPMLALYRGSTVYNLFQLVISSSSSNQ